MAKVLVSVETVDVLDMRAEEIEVRPLFRQLVESQAQAAYVARSAWCFRVSTCSRT
ncbi:hypothetical protein D9M68_71240 [compost metagenome]